MSQNIQSFSIGRHDSVLDPVVNHLYEMPRSIGSTVEITMFGSASLRIASFGPFGRIDAGGQRLENRVEMPNDWLFASDHHAVTPLEPPHAAPGPHVNIVH